MRTGRSRTSGENLFDCVITQSFQSVKSPQIPGRFRYHTRPAHPKRSNAAEAAHTSKNGMLMR